MDFFPELGEPGLADELIYFGPLILQIALGAFYFWLLGRRFRRSNPLSRIAATIGLLFASDVILFLALVVVFRGV